MDRKHQGALRENGSSGSALGNASGNVAVRVLARAQCGDPSAAMALVERSAPAVRAWAHGKLPQSVRNDADTEDVVQDVVLATISRLGNFEHRTLGGMGAYLRASVVNRIRDLLRASGRRGVRETLTDNVCSSLPSALEDTIRHETLDRFLDALQQLRPVDRQLIVWRVKLGYSVEEIAKMSGKSKAAAGMSVTRAMVRLQEALQERAACGQETRSAQADIDRICAV